MSRRLFKAYQPMVKSEVSEERRLRKERNREEIVCKS